MLVIANGAFKSGSTWQYRILKEILPSSDFPREYQNPGWVNTSIDHQKLAGFLQSGVYKRRDIVVKNHFSRLTEFTILNDHPNVFVFDIRRDIRDVVVSAFYHRKHYNSFSGTFQDFFEKAARKIVMGVVRHNDLWLSGGSNVYSGSYEVLQADFEREILRMAAFIEHDLSGADIAQIKEATSFSKMASKGSAFFRKGTVGDWKNHLDRDQLRALSEWVSEARTGRHRRVGGN